MGSDAIERFWAKVTKTDTCWLWTGTTNLDGYGRFNPYGQLVGAHRFSYQINNGEISEALCVLHTCDVPRCVRPDHLYLGTHSDNMQDMYRKKRHGNGKPCICHPDRVYHCKGLCKQCYIKDWHKRHPGVTKKYYRTYREKHFIK